MSEVSAQSSKLGQALPIRILCVRVFIVCYRFSMITVTISSIAATIMHENITNALSVWLSVFTSRVFLCAFIGGRAAALCVFVCVSYLGLQGAGMPS